MSDSVVFLKGELQRFGLLREDAEKLLKKAYNNLATIDGERAKLVYRISLATEKELNT